MERVESSSMVDESPRTGSSAKGGIHNSTRIVDIPFKPADILDWVQVKVKVCDNKVILDEDNNAVTEYYLQITQRLEDTKDLTPSPMRVVK